MRHWVGSHVAGMLGLEVTPLLEAPAQMPWVDGVREEARLLLAKHASTALEPALKG